MSVFRKQGVYCIDYYVNGPCEPIGLKKRLKKSENGSMRMFIG
jgi:hypothetical protein